MITYYVEVSTASWCGNDDTVNDVWRPRLLWGRL